MNSHRSFMEAVHLRTFPQRRCSEIGRDGETELHCLKCFDDSLHVIWN